MIDDSINLIGGPNYDEHVASHYSHGGHGDHHAIGLYDDNSNDFHPIGFHNEDSGTMVALDHEGGMHFAGGEHWLGNIDSMLSHSDPLIHAQDYHCHHLDIGDNINPHLVHVNSYMKSDGSIVDCHFRTAPDGILENNLSYNK